MWSLQAGGMRHTHRHTHTRGTKNAIVCVDGWDSSESQKGREKQREGGGERPLCQTEHHAEEILTFNQNCN